jgi:hypothetical protein
MNTADCDPIVHSVKLFPRLAMSNDPRRSARKPRSPKNPRRAVGNQSDSMPQQMHVRMRLLNMIVENERARRQEQRPSAS